MRSRSVLAPILYAVRASFLVAASAVLALLSAGPMRANAQTAHFSSAVATVGSGFNAPRGVAVGPGGNVFVADTKNNAVKEILAAGGYTTVNTLGSGFSSPAGVAVDGSGNVFVADTGNSLVKEIVATGGYTTVNTLASGFNHPTGVAVDASGNVIVADTSNTVVKEILAAGGYTTVNTLASGFAAPAGVAVDGIGNVFVADDMLSSVYEIVAGSAFNSYHTVGSGFYNPVGVAVDGSGNVFVGDTSNGAVKEIPASCIAGANNYTCVLTRGGGFKDPMGVALDGSGNVFVADEANSAVKEILANADFGSVNVGSTNANPISLFFTFDTSGALNPTTVVIQGVTGLDFNDAGTGTCTTNGTSFKYAIGATCTVDVSFAPKHAGARYGAGLLLNHSGNVIATGYVMGTGLGPLLNFAPTVPIQLPSPNVSTGPLFTAVDGAGNLSIFYPVEHSNYTFSLVKETWNGAGYTASTVGTPFQSPYKIALDGAGNIYVLDLSVTPTVYKETPTASGTYIQSEVFKDPNQSPTIGGLSVDAWGNVYLWLSEGTLESDIEKETPTGQSYVGTIVLSNAPSAPAVDSSGTLYFVSYTPSSILTKATPSNNGYILSTYNLGVDYPGSMAVDGLGNIYVLTGSSLYKETPSGDSYVQTQLAPSNSQEWYGFSVDGIGDVYYLSSYQPNPQNPAIDSLNEVSTAQPPILHFAATPVGQTSSDSPQTVTIQNAGNATMNVPQPSQGSNPAIPSGFTVNDNVASACPLVDASSPSPGTLAAGASCNLTISFSPQLPTDSGGWLTYTYGGPSETSPDYQTSSIPLIAGGVPVAALLTWDNPPSIVYGTALGSQQLNASANVAGTFSYSPATGTILTAGSHTLSVTFTPADSTDFASSAGQVTINVAQATPSISWAVPSAITYGTALSAAQLDATASVAGTFAYTPAAGTIIGAGSQTLSVTLTPTDTTDYKTATATVPLTVNKANQTITFVAPLSVYYGVPPITLSATGGASGNPVTFSLVSGPGSLSGTNNHTLAITGTGTIVVAANQAGSTNYLAANQVTQSITALAPTPAVLTSPTPGTTLPGSSATFTWTAGGGVSQYEFRLGTTGPGSNDVYNAADMRTTALTTGVISVPAYGVTLYARLYSFINGVAQSNDYTYTESGSPVPAVLTSPTPGSTLSGTSATFSWTAGGGMTKYEFRLGTTGVGSKDLYNAADKTTTALSSPLITGIPAYGVTLYARIYSFTSTGASQYHDYTYTESGSPVSATLTSPTPGSTLSGSSATFSWTAGGGIDKYEFRLGTTGPGSSDVYNAAGTRTTALSSPLITGIPAYGVTLYARLYSFTDNGISLYNDYTYTESGSPVKAVLTSPTPGSTLTGSSATFSWTAGGGVTKYEFRLGTTGPGSKDVYNASNSTTTALTTGLVTGIPTTGATLYARLYSWINGVAQYTDYTYTEQ